MRTVILITALALAAGAAGITLVGLYAPDFSPNAVQQSDVSRADHEIPGGSAPQAPGVRGVARYLTTDISATGRVPIGDRDAR